MRTPPKDSHLQVVEEWLEINVKNLTPHQQILILEKAILAVELRASMTLSNITLLVVLDRILHQSKIEYPVLLRGTIDDNLLNFTAMDKVANADDKSKALTYLLVELLRVLGRLSAEILTTALHKELMKVTSQDSEES